MNKLYGAIIGDIAGSVYEFDNIKYCLDEDDLINDDFCIYTDDTVMTLAIAKGISDVITEGWMESEEKQQELYNSMVEQVIKFAHLYPRAGYGGRFRRWIKSGKRNPYNSFGNGSAMRVSYCAWIAKSLEEAEALAKISASITHNHPEGIKGAIVVAGCIFLLRDGHSKQEIYEYVSKYYDIDFSLNDIREMYKFDVTCQGSVPQAIVAFLEGNNFSEVISLAISIGGDSDTIAAIAGSMAEAYYEIPEFLYERANYVLGHKNEFLHSVLNEVNEKIK